jgi:RNA polymerase primary sigma factor
MREIKIEKSFTKRDHDSLRRYLNDIAGYPLLSAEEEVMLGRKIQAGDL